MHLGYLEANEHDPKGEFHGCAASSLQAGKQETDREIPREGRARY